MSGGGLGASRANRPAKAERAAPAPQRPGAWWTLLRSSTVLVWLLAWLAGTAAAATAVGSSDVSVLGVPPVAVPAWVAGWGGSLVVVLYTVAVAHRLDARTPLWGALAVGCVVGGQVYEPGWALAGVSALTAVISGLTAVLLTRPAATWLGVLGEYVVALTVALGGALAVAGLNASVHIGRYTLLVLALSLAVAIAVVWQLGADLHGLGRGGIALVVGAAVLITALLVYSRVLREYGSPAIVDRVDAGLAWMSTNLRGVPQPVVALIGLPALVWGIGVRATRPQGWWLCAFGALGTSLLAASLVSPRLDPAYAGRSALYAVLIGLVLGLAVRRVDQVVNRRSAGARSGGRRALRRGELAAIRPEPGRTRPLR